MDPFSVRAVRSAYDAVAHDYAVAFGDELDQLVVDREVLDLAAGSMPADGAVVEVGCGPAPAARHVAGRGRHAIGVDVSASMLAVARERLPALSVAQADLRNLPLRNNCVALAIGYYVLQHLPRTELVAALGEVHRVLVTGGVFVTAVHLGHGEVVVDDFLGHRVTPFGGTLYDRVEVTEALTSAGFLVEAARERDPVDHEFPSRRLYLVARAVG